MFTWLLILFLVLAVFQKCQGLTLKRHTGTQSPTTSDFFKLSVIHINDFHARFLQSESTSNNCNKVSNNCKGGIARVSTASKQLMNQNPNSIFLNAGDNFQGTIWYNLFKWNVTAEILNKLSFDALTIGNHEFDDGIDGLVPFFQALKSTVVISNINDTNTPSIKGLYKNSKIIERSGHKIGIIGAILSTTNLIAKTETLIFLDEVKSLNSEAEKLKAQGVNIIIALTHCGLGIDRIIAEKCPNVDIIVGGHTHTFLYSGEKPSTDIPVDTYPVVVKQKENNRTVLIVQASAFTRYLGNLTVWFNPEGEVTNWEGNPILLDSTIQEDPEILKALQPWREAADRIGKVTIGKTKVYLYGFGNCQKSECNLGNLVTDAMVDYYVGKDENKNYWTRAAIGCINGGYIRGDISNQPGDVTIEDIFVITPFGNTFNVIELKGSVILEALEKAVASSYLETLFVGKSFLQWSGIKVTYNLSNPENSRVVDIRVRCQACEIPQYDNLIRDEWYRIVVPDFLLENGDNHTEISKNYRNLEPGPLDVDVIVNFIKKKSPIIIGIESRITFLGT